MNLEAFKEKLLKQSDKLKKEIAHYVTGDPYKQGMRSIEVLDDAITEIDEHDRLLATSEQLKRDLVDVETALARIEAGAFGICRSCGNKIEEERLEVMPTATLCLSCQKKSKIG
jgi:RNA polymerase-binding protein DksA